MAIITTINAADKVGDSRAVINSNLSNLNTEIALKEVASNKDQANGYAGLDAAGQISQAQIPAIAMTNVSVVADQVAMLALTAQPGDVATRSDNSTSYMLSASPASTLGNWTELLSPADTAAATHIGTTAGNPHNVTKTDVGLASVDNTADTAKPVSTAQQTALDLKANTSHTHTKADVGLGSVDNTADTAKPVSTAQQTALNGKSSTGHTHTEADITDLAHNAVQIQSKAVATTAPTNGQVLTWNNTNSQYEPATPAAGGGTTSINAQIGTTYTPVLTDEGKAITLTNAAAIALTIPTNVSVAFPVGTTMTIIQGGAGLVTATGAVGVTVNGISAGSKATAAAYEGLALIKTATDTWIIVNK